MRLHRPLLTSLIAVLLLLTMTTPIGFASTPSTVPAHGQRTVTVFVHDHLGRLIEYAVPLPSGSQSKLEASLVALFSGELPTDFTEEIPQGTHLNSVQLQGNTAHIDLSQDFLVNMTQNTSVTMILESILYTSYQFPQVSSVVLTVEGRSPGLVHEQDLGQRFLRQDTPAPDPKNTALGSISPYSVIVPSPKIFIDPGHGGSDPGAVGSDGTTEASVVLDVGLRLKTYLEGASGYVSMSRTTDTYVRYCSTDTKGTGSTRQQMANSWGADAFVSIHANGSTQTSARGHEDYYASNHSATQSQDMATRVFNYFALRYVTRSVNSNATAGYCVLNETTMPAMLTELLFMTNSQDLPLLESPTERDWMAYYLYRGIKDWWCGGQTCTWQP